MGFLFSGFVQLVAPMFGALLFLFFTVEQALWIDVFTFVIAFIPLLFITVPSVRVEKNKLEIEKESKIEVEKDSFWKEFKDGIHTLLKTPGMIVLVILSMVGNFLIKTLN